jgi:hypothetical protein
MAMHTHKTMGTGCVVNPDPMWAVVRKEVLATVLIISSRATHFGGLLPAGSEALGFHAFEARN